MTTTTITSLPRVMGAPRPSGDGNAASVSGVAATRTRALRIPTDNSVWSGTAGRWMAVALSLFALLQLDSIGWLTPTGSTVSDLVYAPGGRVLFPLGVLVVAAVLVRWMRRLAHSRMWWPAVLVLLAVGGMLLVAVFPTDPPGTWVLSTSARIHRYAALAMFVMAPAAAVAQAISATLRRRTRCRTGGAGTAGDAAVRRHTRHLAWCVVGAAAAGSVAVAGRFGALLPDGWQPAVDVCSGLYGVVERGQLMLLIVTVLIAHALAGLTQTRVPTSGQQLSTSSTMGR